MQAPPKSLIERYLVEITKSYNVPYLSPPDITDVNADNLLLIDPPYDPKNSGIGGGGGFGGSSGGGGGGGGMIAPSPVDQKFIPPSVPASAQQPFQYPNGQPAQQQFPYPLAGHPSFPVRICFQFDLSFLFELG